MLLAFCTQAMVEPSYGASKRRTLIAGARQPTSMVDDKLLRARKPTKKTLIEMRLDSSLTVICKHMFISLAIFPLLILPAEADDHGMLTSSVVTSEASKQSESILTRLQPATLDRPQIPLPIMSSESLRNKSPSPSRSKYYISMESSIANPQILQALIQLASPSTIRSFGTDLLVIKVWKGPPSTSTSASSSFGPTSSTLLGGAKLPLAAVGGGGFPLRISLGPENAIDKEKWELYTLSEPQDLWLQAAICRPILDATEVGATGGATSNMESNCPSNYRPVVEAMTVSKWITLPSEDAIILNNGIRPAATLLLR